MKQINLSKQSLFEGNETFCILNTRHIEMNPSQGGGVLENIKVGSPTSGMKVSKPANVWSISCSLFTGCREVETPLETSSFMTSTANQGRPSIAGISSYTDENHPAEVVQRIPVGHMTKRVLANQSRNHPAPNDLPGGSILGFSQA